MGGISLFEVESYMHLLGTFKIRIVLSNTVISLLGCVTKYHELAGLNNRNLLSDSFGGCRSPSKLASFSIL